MTASTIALSAAALTRLRGRFAEVATDELLAAARPVAATWSTPTTNVTRLGRLVALGVALAAHAPAAWAQAQAARDAYLRPQVLARSQNAQHPLDDVLTAMGAELVAPPTPTPRRK